jgi:hypothetical protein
MKQAHGNMESRTGYLRHHAKAKKKRRAANKRARKARKEQR